MRALAATLVLLSCASPAAAQERAPLERQHLIDLAFALGETHALRQACEGANDQYWRQKMMRLTEVEQADQAFDAQLRERFNTGFAAGQAQHPTCDPATRSAEARAAARGASLAARMSSIVRPAARADVSTEAAPQ
jgi:uncharacterized protein (TIGR02301 family)